ncbi:transposase [Leisingera sp. HS039]|uniref:transposase n=1 Tax=unclassified Leisingera TaxID=2614906 RepID=UPI001070FF9C|nr:MULTISPECIES: transposase [unclassified Leisingera]MBQ4823196.1 transposase [Leisingera sp. HS039]QBR38037.1 transposase [Leisingera sp. NJS201]
MAVRTVGLDLAKEVIQVHGISESGRAIFSKAIKRAKLLNFFETLPPCLVAMVAYATSPYWVREITKLGLVVRLIAPGYVKIP